MGRILLHSVDDFGIWTAVVFDPDRCISLAMRIVRHKFRCRDPRFSWPHHCLPKAQLDLYGIWDLICGRGIWMRKGRRNSAQLTEWRNRYCSWIRCNAISVVCWTQKNYGLGDTACNSGTSFDAFGWHASGGSPSRLCSTAQAGPWDRELRRCQLPKSGGVNSEWSTVYGPVGGCCCCWCCEGCSPFLLLLVTLSWWKIDSVLAAVSPSTRGPVDRTHSCSGCSPHRSQLGALVTAVPRHPRSWSMKQLRGWLSWFKEPCAYKCACIWCIRACDFMCMSIVCRCEDCVCVSMYIHMFLMCKAMISIVQNAQ